MLNVFLIYLGIVTYFLIGYYIHNEAIEIIMKNNYLKNLYSKLNNINKKINNNIIPQTTATIKSYQSPKE